LFSRSRCQGLGMSSHGVGIPCHPPVSGRAPERILLTAREIGCFILMNETGRDHPNSGRNRSSASQSRRDRAGHAVEENHPSSPGVPKVWIRRGPHRLGVNRNLPAGPDAPVQPSRRAARSGPAMGAELSAPKEAAGSDLRAEPPTVAAGRVGHFFDSVVFHL
jgi:hypothetical protein